ncbi:hypothetical protein HS088_TW04G01399 [Tripterygium wilfordii]|uniref:Uncharacterized protein n=1 Tax=Tripterygium wilfordii TaxID=458696 RepID=A0A7J7DST9_TRIWF|nr:hypothetical protein HS088_TW04G01399 [Tripterygium wilfordii]
MILHTLSCTILKALVTFLLFSIIFLQIFINTHKFQNDIYKKITKKKKKISLEDNLHDNRVIKKFFLKKAANWNEIFKSPNNGKPSPKMQAPSSKSSLHLIINLRDIDSSPIETQNLPPNHSKV